jgi:hypothetical protein
LLVGSGFPNSYSGRSDFDRTYIFEHLVGYRSHQFGYVSANGTIS